MKYTVLVVDDEYDQRRALIERVDWDAAGFEVIGEAENGVEALDILEHLEPDLILTDIKMPMISGIELAECVREILPATQIAILSGYDDFEYAQAAIEYNIISYLLKPISSVEMTNALIEIHERMDKKLDSVLSVENADIKDELHRLSVNEFLMSVMLGENEIQKRENDLLRRAEELQIINKETPARFCVMVSKFKKENGEYCAEKENIKLINTIMSRHMHVESFAIYGRAVTFAVIGAKNTLNNLEIPLLEIVQTAKRALNQECTIGVSREFSLLSHCSVAYIQAITARRYTSDGAGNVRFIGDHEHDDEFELDYVEKSLLELEQILKVGEDEKIAEFVNSLYENNSPQNINLLVVQVIATVCRVIGSVLDESEFLQSLGSNPLFSRITSYTSEDIMRGELIGFCENAKMLISQSQRRETEILCDKVVEIINEEYSDENLSLTGVSNKLAISPNYLSALIKKNKKKNFITLLTERRMKAAYDMLVCSQMKVLEIAEKCGYSDQHYFSYCFKKFYGDSPNKIRATKGVITDGKNG